MGQLTRYLYGAAMDLLARFNSGTNYITQPFFAPVCDIKAVHSDLRVDGGVCLVIGCHPCWEDDMRAALAIYQNAKICAANFAVELVKADYVGTVHGGILPRAIEIHKNKWGCEPIAFQRDWSEAIDIGYRIDARTHGPSGTFCAAAMVMMGYDLAIMCGSPVNGDGGYAQEERIGNDWCVKESHQRIRAWHNGLNDFKHKFPEVAAKMRSMSGATKGIFGGIDG